jgi:hypothetical protein
VNILDDNEYTIISLEEIKQKRITDEEDTFKR